MTSSALGARRSAGPEARPVATAPAFNVERVRRDFPILRQQVYGKPLVYLDNAATTQKPQIVIDAIAGYYSGYNANVHRGVHRLSELATEAYEGAREKVRGFFNAASTREIIFTRNATEGVNLVAATFGRMRVGAGDQVLISAMEHHSNIVPWQLLCEQAGARLAVTPIDDRGELRLDELDRLLDGPVKLLAITHMSNALGTVTPIAEIVAMAHRHGVPVLVDGAQAAYHMAVDVQALDCDFYVATGHKLYGPTGIGVLYGKEALLRSMPPFMGGGDMIESVTFERSTWNGLPYKFEAGTPHIEGAIVLGVALDYITAIGFEAIGAYERSLLDYGTEALSSIPGVRLIGRASERASILSFVMEGVHPHDIGTIIDREGVAIRTGHHCAQPVMERFSIPATARASLAMYNTREEIDALVRALARVREVFT
jgi:cysteine desulfurase/selenocysteine lyase